MENAQTADARQQRGHIKMKKEEFEFALLEGEGETREKTSEKIIALIKQDSEISAEKLSRELGISSRAVEMQLAKLKEKGILKRIGPDKGGYREIMKGYK